jgi:hypothetical protein
VAGCVPISRNDGFQTLAREHGLEWRVPGPGRAGLAQCIAQAKERIDHNRREITRHLRQIVEMEHSLDPLSARLMAHLSEFAARRLADTGASPLVVRVVWGGVSR